MSFSGVQAPAQGHLAGGFRIVSHIRLPSPALRGHSAAFHRRHAPSLQFGIGSASHAAERRPPVSADYLATRSSAGSCESLFAAGPVRTTFALWPRQPGLQFPKANRVYHIRCRRVNRKPKSVNVNVANVKLLPITNVASSQFPREQQSEWSRAFRLGSSGAEAPSSNRACGFPAHGFPCETGVIGFAPLRLSA